MAKSQNQLKQVGIFQRGECTEAATSEFPSLYTIELENGKQMESAYIRENVRVAAEKCTLGDEESCQHLANMCVLQNHNREGTTACTLFESIDNTRRYT